MERTDRVADLLDGMSPDDLRRATLQAIDHAYKSSAEVAEATAKLQGALGTIAELRDENQQLRALLGRRRVGRSGAEVRRAVRWVRAKAGR